MFVFNTDSELKTLALNGKPGKDDGAGTIEAIANASWMGDIHEWFEIQPAGSNGAAPCRMSPVLHPERRAVQSNNFRSRVSIIKVRT
jgi:hypothetical protein